MVVDPQIYKSIKKMKQINQKKIEPEGGRITNNMTTVQAKEAKKQITLALRNKKIISYKKTKNLENVREMWDEKGKKTIR